MHAIPENVKFIYTSFFYFSGQCKLILYLSTMYRIFCSSWNGKKSKITAKLSDKRRDKRSSNHFQKGVIYHVRVYTVAFLTTTLHESGIDFTKSRKSKINRKCDFQAFDWLKFTLTTDLRLTTFCEIDHRYQKSFIRSKTK